MPPHPPLPSPRPPHLSLLSTEVLYTTRRTGTWHAESLLLAVGIKLQRPVNPQQ